VKSVSKDLERQPLQNQLLGSKTPPMQQIAVITAVVLLVAALLLGSLFRSGSPYSQSVLALRGDPTLGHAIFQMNCSGCHGLSAQGKVGPNLHNVAKHKSRQALIEQVTSGKTPPMPQFHPSPQEMADLLSYLETL
jgi:mono/diheme cytochrome c family protein